MEFIKKQKGLKNKIYAYLKYLLTPFKEIDKAVPDGTILDIGCGKGLYVVYLNNKNRKMTGIDKNNKDIEYAKTISNNIKFYTLDLDEDYELFKADCYLINDVLHHIKDESKEKLLKKVYTSMKKNSTLVIKDMHDENKIKFLLNYINDKIMTGNDKLYFIKEHRLLDILKKIGYKVKVKKIKGFLFPHIIYTCRK